MKTKKICKITAILLFLISPCILCTKTFSESTGKSNSSSKDIKNLLTMRYSALVPVQWNERVTGVKTRIKGNEKVIALTFDACGSARGMAFDRRITDFLEKEQIAATLFINNRWIEPNRTEFNRLAANPLFEIANHGFSHKPASVNGKSVYGISGTQNIGELVDEIELNAASIETLTGRRPRFYRSGTAYYDEVAVKIAGELRQQVAGFSLLGDAGATYSRTQVKEALLAAQPGDIAIFHFNHPESGTADGLMAGLPELKRRGFRFVRLSDVELE
jgi:peptidoglycan/xylan/chitin deacetylase (PgdA/CDA1 family)